MRHTTVEEILASGLRFHRQGQLGRAEKAYREVLRREPRHADALRLLGVVACQVGQTDDGLKLLKRAVKLNRRDPNVHLDMAQALADQGRWSDAVASFRKASDLAPANVVAWGGMASVLFRSGRTAESIRAFRRAIKLAPDQPDLHVGLANALRHLGNLDGASDAFRRALELRPDYAEVHTNLGNVSIELGNLEQAIAHHRRAVELKPGLAQAHHNLACTYVTVRDYDAAVAAFREARRLNPRNFETLNGLASALSHLGRHQESLATLGEVRRLRPDDIGAAVLMVLTLRALGRGADEAVEFNRGIAETAARANAEAALASALETLNDRDGARAAAERALALDHDHLLANVVAARLERRDGQASLARDRLVGLKNRGGTLDAAAYTVMGHAYDRLGDYDAAFTAFATAKEVTARGFGDDISDWKRHFIDHIAALRTWYRPEKAAHWRNPAFTEPRDNPIFFVGFPRSGTTLFEQMLDSHPRLATTGETQILGRLRMVAPSLLKRDGEMAAFLDQLGEDEVATLARWYMDEVGRQIGPDGRDKRPVDKMPLNIVEIGFIRRVFPQAPVIVALRDPRDVILSCFMQNFQVNQAMAHFLTVEGTAKLYAAVMGLWLHYRTDPGLRFVEYRYEDLVADTQGVARRVFDFLGEPWDDRVLDYQRRASERYVATPSYADVATPIYDRSIGRWRNYARHLAPVLEILAPFVDVFGYERDPVASAGREGRRG